LPDDEAPLFDEFSRVFLEIFAITGRQWTSAEVYGKWDGWPSHLAHNHLILVIKYFHVHGEAPEKAPPGSGSLWLFADAKTSSDKNHAGTAAALEQAGLVLTGRPTLDSRRWFSEPPTPPSACRRASLVHMK
jgi:hypothetical protein